MSTGAESVAGFGPIKSFGRLVHASLV